MAIMLVLPFGVSAQKHDKEKYYQIRSMEYGTWKFSPGLYYWSLHNKYSGAEAYWSWSLGNFGLNYRFKEKDSDCKRVGPKRATALVEESLSKAPLQNQIDSIQPLVIEETVRSLERNVDIIYPQYEDDFRQLSENITEGILIAMERGKGRLNEACDLLQMEFDEVCSQIEYIHQTGINHEVEPTKRQLVYEDAKEKLTKLAQQSFQLAYYATTLK